VLVLVRHGQSTANAEGRLLGRTDAPLTAAGLAQARAVGHLLAGTTVLELRSSPLARARDTAEALRTSLPVVVDDRWIEVDYGVHEGRLLAEVPAEVWRQWRRDPAYRVEGGEPLGAVADRVATACAELFARPGEGARAAEGDVVVVSHVSPIKAAVAWALGGDHDLAFRLHLSTGSVTRVDWGPTGPVLETFNQVPANQVPANQVPANQVPANQVPASQGGGDPR
jgi:broad specificity phosphatase PhoE